MLAHGLDTVSPAVNRKLADRILAAGGLFVSEYAPGVQLRPNQLVKRDRLQAGLSRAVIVVETDIKGGTMHTVDFARKQQRRIACLQHPEQFAGANVTGQSAADCRWRGGPPLDPGATRCVPRLADAAVGVTSQLSSAPDMGSLF